MTEQPNHRSLLEAFPEIAAEWAHDFNDGSSPADFPPKSGRRVHWRCSMGHVWRAIIAQRTFTGTGCPYCSGKRCLPERSLSALHPEIATMWDRDKNTFSPETVAPTSGRKVSWKCESGHTWDNTVQATVRSRGYCAKCNSLEIQFPEIARQWDYSKNPDTPLDVAGKSGKRRWFRCDKGHSYKSIVSSRTGQGTGCAECLKIPLTSTNNLAYLAPDLAAEFDIATNGVTPDLVAAASTTPRAWICPIGPDHKWVAQPKARYVRGDGCPFCAGRKPSVTNSLASLYPHLAAQFDVEENGITPNQIVAGSNASYAWRCEVAPDHRWRAIVANRTRKGQGCPCCAGRQTSSTHNLALLFPDIAQEWDEIANGISAAQVVPGSNDPYWWICSKDRRHRWEATPNHRTATRHATGCPYCAGQKCLVEESLAALWPDLAAEWDEKLNDRTPDTVHPGSMYVAHWICRRNSSHHWATRVEHRTRDGSGCPQCTLTPRSEIEIILSFELGRFFAIDPNDHTIFARDQRFTVDIKIPSEMTVVEFDGAYWHRDSYARDARKTAALRDAGWTVIRIRDYGLTDISRTDVTVDTRTTSYKEIANQTLVRLFKILGKDPGQLSDYLKLRDLVHRAEAQAFIDSLLAERKNRLRPPGELT